MSDEAQSFKSDYDNLPPDEKAAWNYDHYYRTRLAIDKYFTSYGLDVAMITGMMERAKESDIRYQNIIDLIDKALLPSYSRELNELESLIADLFDIVLRSLPPEHEVEEEQKHRRIVNIGHY